ncbi:nitrogenase component 1 [Lachnotalea glycerini]|nr:nitrogenase component 1 [Lachnotalea glycerini]
MPLYKQTPNPSGRMGLLWALAPIHDAAIIEYGSMGHMLYANKWMSYTGLVNYAKMITTHLSEKDIALGITQRLEACVDKVVKENKARAIFLLPSSVPEMIGTDLEAIADELQSSYPKIPILNFRSGNFKSEMKQGMEEAYDRLVKELPNRLGVIDSTHVERGRKARFHLLGSGCDWSCFQSDCAEIIRIMEGAFDMKKACVFGAASSVKDFYDIAGAELTLVMREDGLKAAKELKKRYGIPYFYQAPYGLDGTLSFVHALEEILGKKADESFIKREYKETTYTTDHCKKWTTYRKDKAKIWVSKEDELAKGLKDFAIELGFNLEKGEIHMSDLHDLRENFGKCNIEIRRSTLSNDINPYELPFMGFRGAMNLSALWYQHLVK